jgi:DNA repair protein RecN (Recombination protein N)
VEDGSIIISRTVSADGKSKALCGGNAVPAGTLAELTSSLIEIHGQSANSQIVKTARQRELLDRFGGVDIAKSLNVYQESFHIYGALKERLSALKASASKRDGEIAELQEFVAAWNKLKASRGECATTADEINRLSSVEDLRIASSGALGQLR